MEMTKTMSPNVAGARPAMSGSKILLLSPYTGGNLGDAAIQEALIYHIGKRLSAPKIHLLTLCPRTTSELHGLPSFPICASTSAGNILSSGPSLPASDESCGLLGDFAKGVRSPVRRRSWMHRVLRLPRRALKRVGSILGRARQEAIHSAQACQLLKGTELLVIAGGGQLDDFWGGAFGHPWSLFKWVHLARMANTPVVFLSVGVCSLRSNWSRYFTHSALRFARYRSYRDGESKQLLGGAAFTLDDPVYPDLAFSHPYANENGFASRSFSDKPLIIGVSPMACFSSFVWPEHNEPVYQRYIRALSEFVLKLFQAGHSVVLFTTSSMDKIAVKDLQAGLFKKPAGECRLRIVEQIDLNQQLGEIEKMDMVIASRLHGIILAHLLGKPAVAISYDRKVRTHMKAMSQERFCLDLCDFTLPQLWDRFTALASELDPIADSIYHRVQAYRQQLNHQYEFLFDYVTTNETLRA